MPQRSVSPSPQAAPRTPLRTGLWLAREAVSSPEARAELIAALDRRLLKPLPRVRRRLYRLAGGWRPRGPLLPVPGGTLLSSEQATQLPVTMFVLIGAGDQTDEWVERVARAQVESAGFRPLFVVDAPRFTTLRHYGYLFEYVMPDEDWAMLEDAASWPRYVNERLNRLAHLYRPSTVVVLPAGAQHGEPPESTPAWLLTSIASIAVKR